LKYENLKVVNFTTLWDMILLNAPTVHLNNPRKIRLKYVGVVVSELETEYKDVLKSAGLWTNLIPYPMANLKVCQTLKTPKIYVRF